MNSITKFALWLSLSCCALACTPEGSGGGATDDTSPTNTPDGTSSGSDEGGDTTTAEGCDLEQGRVVVMAPLDPGSASTLTTAPAAFVVGLGQGALSALALPAGADGIRDLVVSADRTKLAWSSRAALDGGAADTQSWNLWVANADGSNPTAVTRADVADLVAIKPTFSPDGQTLYFVSNAALDGGFTGKVAAHNVWSIPAAGGSATALTLSSVAGHDVSTDGTPIAVSSDGLWVAFASKGDLEGAFNRTSQPSFNIFVMRSDGTLLESLTKNEFAGLDSVNVQIPHKGPAADKVFFESTTSLGGGWNALAAPSNLWWMGLDGSRRESITKRGQVPSTKPRVSEDGRFVGYVSYADLDDDPTNGEAGGLNVWLYDVEAQTHRAVTAQGLPYTQDILYEVVADQVGFSPDGQWVVFTSNGHQDGEPHLYVLPDNAPPDDPLVLAYEAHCQHPDHQGDKTCEENWTPAFNLWAAPTNGDTAPRLIITSALNLPEVLEFPASPWLSSCP